MDEHRTERQRDGQRQKCRTEAERNTGNAEGDRATQRLRGAKRSEGGSERHRRRQRETEIETESQRH